MKNLVETSKEVISEKSLNEKISIMPLNKDAFNRIDSVVSNNLKGALKKEIQILQGEEGYNDEQIASYFAHFVDKYL